MGYRVEAGLYSAEECGAPHQRKRLFILAIRPGGISQLKKYLVDTQGSRDKGRLRSVAAKNEEFKACKKSREDECGQSIDASTKMGNTHNSGSSRKETTDRRKEHLQNWETERNHTGQLPNMVKLFPCKTRTATTRMGRAESL